MEVLLNYLSLAAITPESDAKILSFFHSLFSKENGAKDAFYRKGGFKILNQIFPNLENWSKIVTIQILKQYEDYSTFQSEVKE